MADLTLPPSVLTVRGKEGGRGGGSEGGRGGEGSGRVAGANSAVFGSSAPRECVVDGPIVGFHHRNLAVTFPFQPLHSRSVEDQLSSLEKQAAADFNVHTGAGGVATPSEKEAGGRGAGSHRSLRVEFLPSGETRAKGGVAGRYLSAASPRGAPGATISLLFGAYFLDYFPEFPHYFTVFCPVFYCITTMVLPSCSFATLLLFLAMLLLSFYFYFPALLSYRF